MHHGFYSPVDRSEEARRRSVWQVGMRVGDAPRDMGPPPGCRALRAPAQRLRAGGRTLTFDVGSAASTDHPAVVSMTGGRSRRAYVVAGGKRHRFRKGRARVPAAAFPIGKAKGLAVRLGGHRVTLRVRADGCL
jgi:hypothetical protein